MKQQVQKTVTYRSICKAIERWIKEHSALVVVYGNWYVGLTRDPVKRKSAHELAGFETYYWKCFNARSQRIALAIESHFHKKGMLEKDLPGGVKPDSVYVYVFKKWPSLLDQLA